MQAPQGPQVPNPIQFNQAQWVRADKQEPKAKPPEPKIRSGNRERNVSLGKNAKGIGKMIGKAATFLDQVKAQMPGSADAAQRAIGRWNKLAEKAVGEGKANKAKKIQSVVQEFQTRLDEVIKGPGNARSPRLEPDVVRANISELKQEAKECFSKATDPNLAPDDSK